ncbi:hypothetical protein DFJ74DRAFT_691244 [Hyaloraphidium curvatum]|nr:hypothetical protein DFJ74DRAFT_691244 [Hyaloraphidium curvatum]
MGVAVQPAPSDYTSADKRKAPPNSRTSRTAHHARKGHRSFENRKQCPTRPIPVVSAAASRSSCCRPRSFPRSSPPRSPTCSCPPTTPSRDPASPSGLACASRARVGSFERFPSGCRGSPTGTSRSPRCSAFCTSAVRRGPHRPWKCFSLASRAGSAVCKASTSGYAAGRTLPRG